MAVIAALAILLSAVAPAAASAAVIGFDDLTPAPPAPGGHGTTSTSIEREAPRRLRGGDTGAHAVGRDDAEARPAPTREPARVDRPLVSVASPQRGSSFTQGDRIQFVANVEDIQDQPRFPSRRIVWRSSLQGVIGRARRSPPSSSPALTKSR
jgi:hypothetical protein